MLRSSTVIIVVIALILLAATLFWQRTKTDQESVADSTPDSTSQIDFGFESAEVVEIVIQDAERITLKFVRGEDGFWKFDRSESVITDSQAVDDALSQMLSLQTVTRISSDTPLQDLGLDPPVYRLLLRLEDGGEMVINVGKITPTGGGFYFLTSSVDRAILVVERYNLETLLNLIETPPILTPSPTVEPSAQGTSTP